MKLDGTETETVDPLSTGGLKTFLIYSIIEFHYYYFPQNNIPIFGPIRYLKATKIQQISPKCYT